MQLVRFWVWGWSLCPPPPPPHPPVPLKPGVVPAAGEVWGPRPREGGGGWICGTVACSAGGMKERESLNLISETQQLFICFLKCWQTGGSRAGWDWTSLFFWSEFG